MLEAPSNLPLPVRVVTLVEEVKTALEGISG
jgi:hypothetical protein